MSNKCINYKTSNFSDLDGELLGGIDVVREEMKDPAFVEKMPKLL
jgi:hypothetical protein